VDENDITSVIIDQEVVITMESYKGKLFRGRVSKIFPIMDGRSRTFRVEAKGDEPTGNLDKKNSDIVFGIFKDICIENKQTILVVTHDPEFASRADRIIVTEDGEIVN